MKNEVLISYLQTLFNNFKVKAEFSTNDEDKKVIVVREQPGIKEVFFGDIEPLYNYFSIEIWCELIRDGYSASLVIGNLIGKHVIFDYGNQKWQLIFKQYSNPQSITYEEIRRVGYIATLQCVVNRVA